METEGKNKYNINSKNFDYSKDDFNWFVNFI